MFLNICIKHILPLSVSDTVYHVKLAFHSSLGTIQAHSAMPTISLPSELIKGVLEVAKLGIIGTAVWNTFTGGDVHRANRRKSIVKKL